MPAIILSLRDLIWFVRAILLLVFGIGLYLETLGIHFFQDLAQNHITTSSILVFLCIISFVQPFIRLKRKDKLGGETVLKKFTAIIVVLLALISVVTYLAMFQHEMLMSTLLGIGGGLGAFIINSVYALIGNPVYQTYGLVIGWITMGITALIVHHFWARIKTVKSPIPVYQGAPTVTPQQIPVTPPVPQQVTPVKPES